MTINSISDTIFPAHTVAKLPSERKYAFPSLKLNTPVKRLKIRKRSPGKSLGNTQNASSLEKRFNDMRLKSP